LSMADKDPAQHYYTNTIRIPYIGLEANIDDLVYLSCLLAVIPLGAIFKIFEWRPRTKGFLSALFGFLISYLVCQSHIWHSILLIFVNSLVLTILSPRYVHYFSFIWCFGYLLFFRTTTYFGIEKPVQFANAVQLILTLKAIGVGFEIHDTYMRKKNLFKLNTQLTNEINTNKEKTENYTDEGDLFTKEKQQIEKLELEIEFFSLDSKLSFLDLCLYCYCHVGILTGPYFKYRTYYDWLNMKYNKNISVMSFVLKRSKTLPFIIVAFIIVSKFASFSYLTEDAFYSNPFWYRFIYMGLCFTLFRLRFYFAWILAEFSCMTACFGVYPTVCKPRPGGGPTNLAELKKFDINESKDISFSFNAVHNINEYGVEFCPTVKDVLHTWNESVQYWMATFVYKRVFYRPIGQPWTMFVSAYWHGLHPGYYMSLLTCTPGIWAEQYMDKGFKQKFMKPNHYYLFDMFTWFCRCRLFDYMSIGFILLDYKSTMRFWGSVYYCGHVYCVFFILLGYTLCILGPKQKKKEL